MSFEILFTSLLIVLARICDVSLGTIRTVCIIKNRKYLAFGLGFVEALVWIFVITTVANNLSNPFYAVAYAFGFALGNFIGMVIEQNLGMGTQVLRVFTRKSEELLLQLRLREFKVTKFVGEGHGGEVDMLLLTLARKRVKECLSLVSISDPESYFFVDDVVESYEPRPASASIRQVRRWVKKK